MSSMEDFQAFMDQSDELDKAVKNNVAQPTGFSRDETLWYPNRDGTGQGRHLIRFLPQADATKGPIVNDWVHSFKKADGKRFYAKCRAGIGETCPICAWTSPLWDASEADKKLARKYYRSKRFVTNALIIEDTVQPENSGKVMKFRFGVKIRDKIVAKLEPEFSTDSPINVFDFGKGADFKLKVKTVSNYPNYDDSEFSVPAPLAGGDKEKMFEVFNSLHDLSEFENITEDPEVTLKRFIEAIDPAEACRGDMGKMAPGGINEDLKLPESDPFDDSGSDDSEGGVADPFGETDNTDNSAPFGDSEGATEDTPTEDTPAEEPAESTEAEAPATDGDDASFFANLK